MMFQLKKSIPRSRSWKKNSTENVQTCTKMYNKSVDKNRVLLHAPNNNVQKINIMQNSQFCC